MKDFQHRKIHWMVFILISLVFPTLIVLAQSQPILKIDPPQLGLKPGDQAKFSLQIEGVQDFYGLEVHIQYNPDIIEIIDADTAKEGVQCKSGAIFDQGFIAQNQIANGRIDFAATLLNPAPPFSGNGEIFECQVRGKNMGQTAIEISQAIFANRNGEKIDNTNQSAQVVVSESGKVAAPTAKTIENPQQSPKNPIEGRLKGQENWLIYIAAGAGVILFLIALVMAVRTTRHKT